MGACAQIAVFTYAVMRRTPRYEIRLAAPFADNLMNSVAHCGELPINVERPPVPFLSPQRGHSRQDKLLCTLKPRYGALHTRFDDYTPRNVRLPGLD